MPETAVAPTQADPKGAAANIAKGVQDKAAGKGQDADRGKDAGAGAQKGQAQQADPNAGKTKYVVEGKEVWLTPAQEKAYAQKGIAFEPRVSELDRMRREMAQFEQALLNDPGKILANLAQRSKTPIQTLVQKVLSSNASEEVKEATGLWYWENVAKRMKMDPKDRDILERDERITALEAQEKQRTEMAMAAENRARVVKALGEVSAQIQETLKDFGLTSTDGPAAIRLVKEIADVMRVSYFARQPCTAKQAAEKVKARIMEYQRQFYDTLDMDRLVETLGKENAEKVRKHFLKVVQEAGDGEQKPMANAKSFKRDERKTINSDDFHDYLDQIKQTGAIPGKK